MPEKFQAIIVKVYDTSHRLDDVESGAFGTIGRKTEVRSAKFVLQTMFEFPWPPSKILGKKVRVIIED